MEWIYGLLMLVCVVMTCLLLRVNCRSRYWLSGFMLFLSAYLGLILLDAQAFYIAPILYFLLLSIIFLPGPLLLGYISHISTESHVSARDFIPVCLPGVTVVTCWGLIENNHRGLLSNQMAYQTDSYVGLFNLVSAMAGLVMLMYLLVSIGLLIRLKQHWAGYQSQTLPKSWHKMVQVMAVTLMVTVLQVLSAFVNPSGDRVSIGDLAFIGFVIYFIVLAVQTTLENRAPPLISDLIHETIGRDFHEVTEHTNEQYESDESIEQIGINIKHQILADQLHLQSELTLPSLAMMLDTTPHKLSMYINKGFGVSFYEFINDLRIGYAANLLLEHPSKPITDVLFEAGFTAKSTFYSHFKKVHGVTPTQFRKQT